MNKKVITGIILSGAVVLGGGLALTACGAKSYQVKINSEQEAEFDGSGTYKLGDTIVLTAGEVEGYRFVEWQLNGQTVSTENPYTFALTKRNAGEYTAVYKQIYTVSFAGAVGGNVELSVADAVAGDIVEITNVTINDHYRLPENGLYYKVEGDEEKHVITGNQFVMPEGIVTVYADFELMDYTLSIPANVTVTRGGEVITSSDTIHYQDVLVVTYTETLGYHVTSFKVNGVDKANGAEINVEGNVSITYTEAVDVHVVKFYDADGNVVETKNVEYGSSVSFSGDVPTKDADATYTYTFDKWVDGENHDADFESITDDMSFYPIFTPTYIDYTITYMANGEQFTTQTYHYQDEVVAPTQVPTKLGYTFAHWQDIPTHMPASGLTLVAVFTANEDTLYTVEHYKQNIDATEYVLVENETEEKEGRTDTQTQAVAKNYTGFTAKAFEQKNINADGQQVVKIYYERDVYDVVYMVDGVQYEEESYRFEEAVSTSAITSPSKTGYTFAGWGAVPGTMPASNVILNAVWTPNTNTAYCVDHYQQNAQGTGYTVFETQELTGTTDQKTQAAAKTYDGFTAQGFEQETIAAGGTTRVGIYYNRNSYTITYMNGDVKCGEDHYLFGATIDFAEGPSRAGYTFNGWDSQPVTMPANNLTLTATWLANEDTPYHVEHYQQNTTGDGYTKVSTQPCSGTTGELTEAVANSYDGFTVQEFNQVAIAGTGDTIIKIYYNRNTHTITYTSDNEQYAQDTYRYGAAVTAPTPTKTGYTFAGWTPAVPNTMPDENLEFTASWTARTDTAYIVNHYKQNVTGDGYLNAIVQECTGTTAAQTDAKANTYEGFTAKPFSQAVIKADGTTEINIYYERISYTITYKTDGAEYTQQPYLYGAVVVLPDAPEKDGYTFNGWDSQPTTMPANDLILTATWLANEDTPYHVEHYQQNTTGDGYTKVSTQPCSGTTGELTEAVANSYDGFTVQEFNQVAIAGTGDTIIKIYYNRNTHTITYTSDGVQYTQDTYRYGATVTAPTPTKTGYNFAGWGDVPATMPDENLEFTASWTARTDTAYKVNHHKQNVAGNGYLDAIVQECTGTTAAQTAATAYDYEGFTAKPFSQAVIKADGTTEINIYYERISYTITYKTDGAEYTQQTYRYGANVVLPDEPTKQGYDFDGWSNEPGTMPAENLIVNATWTARTDTAFKVNHYKQNVAGNGYLDAIIEECTGTTATTTAITANVYEGFTAQGFDQAVIKADGSTEIDIYYTRNEYTITYMNEGVQHAKDTYRYEADVTAPANPAKTGYTFAGWGADIPETMPAGNLTFTAAFTANTNTVYTVKHYQQNILDNGYSIVTADTQVLQGTTDTQTQAVAKNYTGFTAQAFSQANIDGDGNRVIEIYYDRNIYEITFVDYNEDVITEATEYKYGATVVLPDDPQRAADNIYTYTFKAWSPAVTAVAGNQTYTATYDEHYIEYKIKFVNYDGTVVSNEDYHYGATVVEPDPPSKASDNTYNYVFDGWDSAITTVTADKTYRATFRSVYIDYTVKFYNGEEVYATKTTHYNEATSAPETDPEKDSDEIYDYNFVGWVDSNGDPVTNFANVHITAATNFYASYEPVYINYHLTIPEHVTVTKGGVEVTGETDLHYGDKIIVTCNPTPGYHKTTLTIGGVSIESGTEVSVTGNMTIVYAEAINVYTVIFHNGESTYATQNIEHGSNATTPAGTPEKTPDDIGSYTFVRWEDSLGNAADLTNITANTDFYAKYDISYKPYSLTLVNGEHIAVYKGETRIYNEATIYYYDTLTISYTESTGKHKTTFTVNGVDKDNNAEIEVAGNVTIEYAEAINVYDVVFHNGNTTFDTQNINHGSKVQAPDGTPEKITDAYGSYTFQGWAYSEDGEVVDFGENGITITSATDFYAVYTCNYTEYTLSLPSNVQAQVNGENYDKANPTPIHYHDVITLSYTPTANHLGVITPTNAEKQYGNTYLAEGNASFEYDEGYDVSLLELVFSYDNTNHTASVHEQNLSIAGEVVIPSKIAYNDAIYHVTAVDDEAFIGCVNLTKIVIPASVTYIGTNAFKNCINLTSALIEATNPIATIGTNAFANSNNAPLVVRGDKLDEYKTAWTGYEGRLTRATITMLTSSDAYMDYDANVTTLTKDSIDAQLTAAGFTRSNVTAVYLGDTITTIDGSDSSNGTGAFNRFTAMTTVVLPDSLIYLNAFAFYGCEALTSAVIPQGVQTMGICIFENCYALESVTIPSSVTAIGNYTFKNCTSLATLNYNGNVSADYASGHETFKNTGNNAASLTINIGVDTTLIPAYMFKGIGKAGQDTIVNFASGSTLGEIKANAFENCYYIRSLSLPDSLETIGDNAFKGCSGISTLTFGSGVKTIGSSAFEGCTSVASAISLDIVETIGASAFKSCSNIAEVDFGDSLTSIGASAFEGCSSLEEINLPSTLETIGDSAFKSCTSITSAILPDSVETIGASAFNGCSAITTVYLGERLTSLGSSAFEGTTAVTQFTYNGSLNSDFTDTEHATFKNMGNSGAGVDLIIGNHVSYVPAYMFGSWNKNLLNDNGTSYAGNITSLTIPSSVTGVGKGAFRYLYNLTTLNYNGSITADGIKDLNPGNYECVFQHIGRDGSGVTLNIGANATNIPTYMFKYNKSAVPNIKVITFAENSSLVTIGEKAFSECTNLTTLGAIPSTVRYIDWYAFEKCSSLTSVSFASDSHIEYIQNAAFEKCSALTSVTIPTSTYNISIGDYAFSECGCNTISLSSSVTAIGAAAFKYNKSLQSLYYNARLPLARSKPSDYTYPFESAGSNNGYKNVALTIGADVVNIPDYMFTGTNQDNRPYFTSLTFEDGSHCEAIGYAAFDRAEVLTTVVFPASLKYIGYGAFGTSKDAGGLTSATFTNTTGWVISNSSDPSGGGSAIDVTNASTNATNLHKDQKQKYWHRIEE